MEHEIGKRIAAIERLDEKRTNRLELALNCIEFLGFHLNVDEKQELLLCIGNFNLPKYKLAAFKIIAKQGILEEGQVRIILDALVDQLIRTQLIIKISAMESMKVPVDGVETD